MLWSVFITNILNQNRVKNATLIYSDTDSLIYTIITDDVYEDMIKYNGLFDFSDYQPEHKLYKMNIIGQDGQGKNIIKNCKYGYKYIEIRRI